MQLAKAGGLKVIADASARDQDLVASFGADMILPRGDDFAELVRQEFPEGVDGLADGAVLSEKVIYAVRDNGAFSSVRGWQGTGERQIHFETTSVRDYALEFCKLKKLSQQVEEGILTLRVAKTYKSVEASEAHRLLEGGGLRGRIVREF